MDDARRNEVVDGVPEWIPVLEARVQEPPRRWWQRHFDLWTARVRITRWRGEPGFVVELYDQHDDQCYPDQFFDDLESAKAGAAALVGGELLGRWIELPQPPDT